MAIDLDRFKALNDAAGHAAGDTMLRKAAEACRTTVRSPDTVARPGRDEFAIVLGNCAEERVEWLGSYYSVGASLGLCRVGIFDR